MKVKSEREVAQLCSTLSDPMDYSLPGSSVHGIFQARVLEWVAIGEQRKCDITKGLEDCFRRAWSMSGMVRIEIFLDLISQFSRSVVSDSSRPHGLQPTRLLHPWDFPGKSTGVEWGAIAFSVDLAKAT